MNKFSREFIVGYNGVSGKYEAINNNLVAFSSNSIEYLELMLKSHYSGLPLSDEYESMIDNVELIITNTKPLNKYAFNTKYKVSGTLTRMGTQTVEFGGLEWIQ